MPSSIEVTSIRALAGGTISIFKRLKFKSNTTNRSARMDGSYRSFGETDDVYYDAADQNRNDILKLVLYDLNSAIAPQDIRLMAINAALEEFDHDDEVLHDEELELRADHILLQKLTYAMCIDRGSVEVGYILCAMEAVYRAGRTRLAASFHEICDALLPLVVEMIRPPPDWTPLELTSTAQEEEDAAANLRASQTSNAASTLESIGGSGGMAEENMNVNRSAMWAPTTSYGDFDEESAESVEIPSGTGEYMQDMHRASMMGGASAYGQESTALPPEEEDVPDANIAPAGEYLEDLHRRASVGSGTVEGSFASKPTAPSPAAEEQVNSNALVPVAPALGDGYQQALVAQGSNGVDNDRIRMELNAAMETMGVHSQGNQVTTTETAAGPPSKRLSIESAEIVEKRLSMETGEDLDAYYDEDGNKKHSDVEDEGGALQLRGGGMEGIDDGEFGDEEQPNPFAYKSELSDLAEEKSGDENPNPFAYQSELNNLVHESGSAYAESQDNPFSDTSSFIDKNCGSTVGGFSEGGHTDNQDNPFSDTSSLKHESHDNPFSDASSLKYGGSSDGTQPTVGTGFSESKASGATERETDRFPPRIDELDESGASSQFHSEHKGGEDTTHQGDSSKFDEHGGYSGTAPAIFTGFDDESAVTGVPKINGDAAGAHQRAPEFDEHGGYSGAAPSIFTGYDDEGGDESYVHPESKAGDDNSTFKSGLSYERSAHDYQSTGSYKSGPSYDPRHGDHDSYKSPHDHQSTASGPSYDPNHGDYNSYISPHDHQSTGSFKSGPSYERSAPHYSEVGSEYTSSVQGEGREGMNPYMSDYRDDDPADLRPHAHRQSELTDSLQSDYQEEKWVDQNEPIMESESMGERFGEERNIMHSEAGFRMSELEANLPPEPQVTQYQLNQMHQMEQNEQEANYVPYEMPDEDIFQFKEPRLPMTAQDYFNYSDPVEGEICPLAVRKVLKILRYFSRVLSAMEILAQQSGLVDSLLYHMTKKPLSTDYEDEISSRVDAIAVVVNLACAEENKIMLVYHPGLLDAIINIANHDPIDEAREHAAIVLMNLAYAEENKVHMVNQDHLLDTLVHLLSDVSPFTRRYASAALFTLACTYANTAVMARHCDGGILEALRKVLLNDPIDEARVNAAEALFNMARNNSDDTVENMGNHPRLLASLSHSVLTDYSADVRAYSARALEWLSADIHHPMPCHRILLKALTKASQWTKTTCIAEALKMQASLTENRKPMVEHPGLLDALGRLSLMDDINDDEVKTCATSALERLSKEGSTRHIMVKNEGVMTALTKATFANDGLEEDVPDEGTPTALLMKTALKNLAEHM